MVVSYLISIYLKEQKKRHSNLYASEGIIQHGSIFCNTVFAEKRRKSEKEVRRPIYPAMLNHIIEADVIVDAFLKNIHRNSIDNC